MPKKVITRRQRKAAEAKRLSNERERQNPPENQSNVNMVATPPSALDAEPSCSSVKTESSCVACGLDKPTCSNTPTIKNPGHDAEKPQLGKTTVTIILGDNKVQADKIFEGEDNESTAPKVETATATAGLTQPTTLPSDSKRSFSKALSRRAAATIAKIQKLSKVFNKIQKFNNKPSSGKAPIETNGLSASELDNLATNALNEPNKSDTNKTCNCEFCKVVLSQLLTNKKRQNDKKSTKNSARRQGNTRRSVSPKKNIVPSQHVNANSEEDQSLTTIVETSFKTLKTLEKKEKRLEKDVMKNILEINKLVNEISDQPSLQKGDMFQTSYEKKKRKSNVNKSKRTLFPEPLSNTEPTESAKKISSTKADYLNAIQKLSSEQADTPPIKIIGNTGYFVLTGTDTQLAEQLNDLQNKNVSVQKCVLLEPGLTDNLEKQLEDLDLNREQILRQMHEKHNMLATRRKKRVKKSRHNKKENL